MASGDPLQDRIVLWTRVTPEQQHDENASVEGSWALATDPYFGHVAASGTFRTTARQDYTVKVDVVGLDPGTTYYYRFRVGESVSPTGRTRTAPSGNVDQVRLAVASCSSYPHGYFNACRLIAARSDLDAVLHLGDYIYEYGPDLCPPELCVAERLHSIDAEASTLAGYRARYALYRSDPDLQALHKEHAAICIWDDHEFEENSWRGGARGRPADETGWAERRAAALQAFHEWQPVRAPSPADLEHIYRSFSFGSLVDILMLDTRIVGRDVQLPAAVPFPDPELPVGVFTNTGAFADEERQLLGKIQETWLFSRLRESRASWRLLGQQVMMAQLKIVGAPNAADGTGGGLYLNPDQWDGYSAARRRLLDVLAGAGGQPPIGNVVVLAGDLHVSLASDITPDPNNVATYSPLTGTDADGRRTSLAVEFVCPAVTSPSLPEVTAAQDSIRASNPHIKYVETASHGYLVVDITPKLVQAEWWYVDTVRQQSTSERLGRSICVKTGESFIRPEPQP